MNKLIKDNTMAEILNCLVRKYAHYLDEMKAEDTDATRLAFIHMINQSVVDFMSDWSDYER